MATEALRAPGTQDGITPQIPTLPNFDIPGHLRRRTLIEKIRSGGVVPEKTWGERANEVEVRGKKIIATQNHVVKNVVFNPPSTAESDLTLEFVDGFGIKKGFVEIKSSTQGLGDYKDEIIKDIEEKNNGQLIGPWARDLARQQWLVDHNTILMNVGEKDRRERTTGEILYESFYPQFDRIRAESQRLRKDLGGLLREYHKSRQLEAFDAKPIQIFPEIT